MRSLFALLLFASCALLNGGAVFAQEGINAPKTMPERIGNAWTRLQSGGEGENLLYVNAAADKFNIPAPVLATFLMCDILSHHKDWAEWAKANPEVRTEGAMIHISAASALSEGLLRTDLVIPEARRIFEKKRNDINYMLNPQPGVDHWYQSCLEAAEELMKDDAIQIGVLGRQLRRTADGTATWSTKLSLAYARPSTEDVQRLLSQARAWPEGAMFEWDKLQPGRDRWSLPTTALVYGRYRMRAFDAEPHDEMLGLAAQVYQWLLDHPEALAELTPPDDAPGLVPYTDPTEDYSYQ